MKPQSWFIVKATPFRHDALVKLVQVMCTQPFMKDIIAVGPWEFEISRGDDEWWHLNVTAEYEVWINIHPEPMQKWLKERMVEYEGEGLSAETGQVPERA